MKKKNILFAFSINAIEKKDVVFDTLKSMSENLYN